MAIYYDGPYPPCFNDYYQEYSRSWMKSHTWVFVWKASHLAHHIRKVDYLLREGVSFPMYSDVLNCCMSDVLPTPIAPRTITLNVEGESPSKEEATLDPWLLWFIWDNPPGQLPDEWMDALLPDRPDFLLNESPLFTSLPLELLWKLLTLYIWLYSSVVCDVVPEMCIVARVMSRKRSKNFNDFNKNVLQFLSIYAHD